MPSPTFLSTLTLLSLSLTSLSSTQALSPRSPHQSQHQAAGTERNLVEEVARSLGKREIITAAQANGTYDFVIAGGGLAGLVLASRLSEDSDKTVLVIEAGDTGDAVKGSIDVPGNAYYSSLLNTDYDWQYTTTPQTHLGNRVLQWPRGRVLGGSTAVNGLYLVRPSAIEIDAWSKLAENGTSLWTWDALFEAMKKSENFTAPSTDIQSAGAIEYNIESHGTDGPLSYSYPGYLLPIVGDWTTVLENIGVEECPDPNGGETWGAFIATSSINPTNWTRAYAKSAYIDNLPPRPNLHILPNARVMNVNTVTNANGTVTATGISYQTAPGAASQTITANKEVILSGGAIGSPQILMTSGIGPKAALEALGIKSVIDLPGVGQHVQDHLASQVIYTTSASTAASEVINQTLTNGSESFFSFVNSAIAYVNVTDLFGDWDATFQSVLRENFTWSMENVLPNADPTVLAGYAATYNLTVDDFALSPLGQIEILLGLTGTAQGGDNSIAIQAALQHPFSRGQITLKTASAWDYPIIDPNYLSHPADVLVLREGLKLCRKLFQTAPLSQYMNTEVFPGPQVQTDAEWDAWLPTEVTTEYHPGCTCSMMPLELGGVVDAYLKVHGTTNLRVVDASVFPFEFSAHLQAPTYGLAEQASDLIKMQYWAESTLVTSTNSNATTASATSAGAGATGAASGSVGAAQSGARAGVKVGLGFIGMVMAGVVAAWTVM